MAPHIPSIAATLSSLSAGSILAIVAVLTLVRYNCRRTDGAGAQTLAEYAELGIVGAVLVWMLIRPFALQAYFIPSPSMEPTLFGEDGSGDRILVNKFTYRVGKPGRDNVVVFVPPYIAAAGDQGITNDNGVPVDENGIPVNFIKRLIGLPGDTLEAHAGVIFVDSRPYDHDDIRKECGAAHLLGDDWANLKDLQSEYHVKFLPGGVEINGSPKLVTPTQIATMITGNPASVVKIIPGYTVRNGQRLNEPFTAEDPDYNLKIYNGQPLKNLDPYKYQYKYDGPGEFTLGDQPIAEETYDRDNLSPTGEIPAGQYFMMGDNRNDSKDSTVWGPLDAAGVIGRAQFIFWPLNRAGAIR